MADGSGSAFTNVGVPYGRGPSSGKTKKTIDQAGKVSMYLTSCVRIILSQRGYTKQTIFNLIYASIHNKRLDYAQNRKWDSKIKKVTPGEAV